MNAARRVAQTGAFRPAALPVRASLTAPLLAMRPMSSTPALSARPALAVALRPSAALSAAPARAMASVRHQLQSRKSSSKTTPPPTASCPARLQSTTTTTTTTTATTTTACSAPPTTRGVPLVSARRALPYRLIASAASHGMPWLRLTVPNAVPPLSEVPSPPRSVAPAVAILLFIVVGGLATSVIALVVGMWNTWGLGRYFGGK